jgi:hypothetical protein
MAEKLSLILEADAVTHHLWAGTRVEKERFPCVHADGSNKSDWLFPLGMV